MHFYWPDSSVGPALAGIRIAVQITGDVVASGSGEIAES
jgi:hypothetical protein